jgi:hypothetical protein
VSKKKSTLESQHLILRTETRSREDDGTRFCVNDVRKFVACRIGSQNGFERERRRTRKGRKRRRKSSRERRGRRFAEFELRDEEGVPVPIEAHVRIDGELVGFVSVEKMSKVTSNARTTGIFPTHHCKSYL